MSETTEQAHIIEQVQALAEALTAIGAQLQGMAGRPETLIEDQAPEALGREEWELFDAVRAVKDAAKAAESAATALNEGYNEHMWQRMEEAGVASVRMPELGALYSQSQQTYLGMNREYIDETGLDPAEAVDQVIQFLRDIDEGLVNDLVDFSPRLIFQRMRGKEYWGAWMTEGYIPPPVLKPTVKHIISRRKA